MKVKQTADNAVNQCPLPDPAMPGESLTCPQVLSNSPAGGHGTMKYTKRAVLISAYHPVIPDVPHEIIIQVI